VFKLSASLCKLFSLFVVVRGCRKCSNEPGMSCTCKLFAAHVLFDVITEQINDDDDDDDDDIIGSDRRPETKQGIEGKIVRFRSGRVRRRVRVRDK